MSYSKIAPLILYIIIGITIPLMILFFAGNSLINEKEFQSKVNKIENPAGKSQGSGIISDLQSADSLSTSADSSAIAQETVAVTEEQTEQVKLNLIEKLVYFKTDIPLVWGYLLLIISIAIALIFPIIYMFLHPTNLVRTLLVLVGVAVLVGLAFMVAPGTSIQITGYTGDINSKALALKLIDTGLIFSYFILGLTLLSILISEVSLYFR